MPIAAIIILWLVFAFLPFCIYLRYLDNGNNYIFYTVAIFIIAVNSIISYKYLTAIEQESQVLCVLLERESAVTNDGTISPMVTYDVEWVMFPRKKKHIHLYDDHKKYHIDGEDILDSSGNIAGWSFYCKELNIEWTMFKTKQ